MIQDSTFFLPGNRNGVLLIHGLTGTPTEMRIIAKGLNKAGFTVYAMQLAGHCGDENDLRQTTWQDWYRSVEQAADFLAEKVDNVFVAGLSMGAVLSLKLAADRPEQIKAVGVYGVTFHYDGWSIPFWVKHGYFLLKWFKKFNLFQKTSFNEQPPYGLKDERIRATVSESMIGGDSAAAGLAGNPLSSLAEMQELVKQVKKQLPNITVPCLIMHSSDDDIASIATNAELVQKTIKGKSKLVALHDSYHLITIDRERRTVINETVAFFNHAINVQTPLDNNSGQEDL